MGCLNISELPSSPPGKSGWPWTEASPQLPDTMPDGSPWPKVSIVTPSYNQAEFVEETIRSVLLQRYPNLEYIIIDGGSMDNSVETIRQYEKWLAFWASEPDNGQSDAINKGWRMASGEILAWLNSDDMYMPGAVGAAVEALSKHPRSGLVYGNAIKMDRAGNDLGVHYARKRGFRWLLRLSKGIPYRTPQPTAFVRANVVKQVGYLKTDLHYAMDYDLFLRAAGIAPAIYLTRVQAKMRLYLGTKTSTNVLENWREKLSVMRIHNRLWFLSPAWFRYLRYRLWRQFPPSFQTRIRILRDLPRDRVNIEAETEGER